GRTPALFEDRLLQALDVTVRLRAAGADPALLDGESLERLPEVSGAILGAVVRDHGLQPPARAGELGGDTLDERAAVLGGRVLGGGVELCPCERGGDVDRRVLPDRALRPGEAAYVEAVEPNELTRA